MSTTTAVKSAQEPIKSPNRHIWELIQTARHFQRHWSWRGVAYEVYGNSEYWSSVRLMYRYMQSLEKIHVDIDFADLNAVTGNILIKRGYSSKAQVRQDIESGKLGIENDGEYTFYRHLDTCLWIRSGDTTFVYMVDRYLQTVGYRAIKED